MTWKDALFLSSIIIFKRQFKDFPGSPVVKTLPSNTGVAGSISGWGAEIPHASWPKKKKKSQKQYCNKFKKYFKMVHIKISL